MTENTDRREAERKADAKADWIAILVVFTMLVLGALSVHTTATVIWIKIF